MLGVIREIMRPAGRGWVRRLGLSTVVAVASLALPGFVAAAGAAAFSVTGTTDSVGACSGTSCPSLRSAVLASNAAGGTNTINLPAGHYALTRTPSGTDDGTTGDLHITANLTITGAGAATTTIAASGDRIFDITANVVTLSGMTMTGGNATSAASGENAGGAVNDIGASLTLSNDVFTNNTAAAPGGFGGAVHMHSSNDGALIVTNSTFRSNTAANSGTGGGGFGGAISFEPNSNGTLAITNSTFDSNTSQSGTTSQGGFGGGIDMEPGEIGTLNITGSTFSSNVAAGATGAGATQGGFGGAINFEPGASGSALAATNSTFTRNSAGGPSGFGGAIDFEPSSGSSGTLTHVTIVGNSATNSSSAGGVDISGGPMTFRNSIISGNTIGSAAGNCAASFGGSILRTGHNIEQGTTCGFDINANPLLLALASNGGPTQTMAIAATSPARDAAATAFCPATDQRGVARPDDPGTPCDIGAFEFNVPPVIVPPQHTKIEYHKINKKKRTAKFKFDAKGTVKGFECELTRLVKKGKHYKPRKSKYHRCASPKTYRHLDPGRYIFRVKAYNSSGADHKPAVWKFRI